jgi:hypothetical protein
MFGLTDAALRGTVLDCAAGGSSFVAETDPQEIRALAMDPLYALGARTLARRLPADLARGLRMINQSGHVAWDWHGSPARHREIRRRAASEFLTDMRQHPGRYIAACLPRLPLTDASVDLVLCSHLLFTWAHTLDQDWHRASILEMCRVGRSQVRIFPLANQGAGHPVTFLDRLRRDIETTTGAHSELVTVPYEFQLGANRMLKIHLTDHDHRPSRQGIPT